MDEDDQLESHMFTLDLLLKMLFVTSSFFLNSKNNILMLNRNEN